MKRSWSEFLDNHAFLALWIVVWSGFTIAFIWLSWPEIWFGWRSESYPVVDGSLVASAVQEDRSGDDGPSWQVKVCYAYEVRGQRYESTRWRWGRVWRGASREVAEQALAALRAKKSLRVYYDPAQPSRAVLRPGVGGQDYFMLAFGYPFVLTMLAGWYFGWRQFRIECLDPPAAGLPLQRWAGDLCVLLDQGEAALQACALSFGLGIVLMIACGLARLDSRPLTSLIVVIVDVGSLAVAYGILRGRISRLVLEPSALTLHTHSNAPQRIEHAELEGVWVRPRATYDTAEDTVSRHVVACGSRLAPERDLPIVEFSEHERALEFRAWLCAQPGLGHATSEAGGSRLHALRAVAAALPREWRTSTDKRWAMIAIALFALITLPAVCVTVWTVVTLMLAKVPSWWMFLIAVLGVVMAGRLKRMVVDLQSPVDQVFAIDEHTLCWGVLARGASVDVLRRRLQGLAPNSERGLVPLSAVSRIQYRAGADDDLVHIFTHDGRQLTPQCRRLNAEEQDQLVLIVRTHFPAIHVSKG